MKVLFIYPDICSSPVGLRAIPNYSEGIASLAAVLDGAGLETSLLHLVRPPRREEVIRRLREEQPALVFLHATANQIRHVEALAPWLKEADPTVTVVCGGMLPTFMPEQVLGIPGIDLCALGEGEDLVAEMARVLLQGGRLEPLCNLWSRDGGAVRKNPLRPLIQDLDTLPFPRRRIFEFERCFFPRLGIGPVILSRGCRYACPYCFHSGYRTLYPPETCGPRRRSVENSLAYLHAYRAEFPWLRQLWFWDDILPMDLPWLRAFCGRYPDEVGLPFTCLCHPSLMTEEVASLLASAGGIEVCMGVESGDADIRRTVLGRPLSDEALVRAFEIARRAGLQTLAISMLGVPHETLKTLGRTIRLNARIAPRRFYHTLCTPYPGTELYRRCEDEGLLTDRCFDSYLEGSTLNLPGLGDEQLRLGFLAFPYLVRLQSLLLRLGLDDQSPLGADLLLRAPRPLRLGALALLRGHRELSGFLRTTLHRSQRLARASEDLRQMKAALVERVSRGPLLPEASNWDEWAETFDQDGGAVERLNDALVLEREDIGTFKGLRVLEVGCGTGRLLETLARAGAQVTGLDISPGMLAVARRRTANRPNVTLIQADILDTQAPDRPPVGAFDLVVSAHALHHLDTTKALKILGSFVAPGGLLLVIDAVQHTLADLYLGFYGRYLREYGLRDTAAMALRTSGFTGRLPVPHHFHRHVKDDRQRRRYLSEAELRRLAEPILPGSIVTRENHLFAQIVWRCPSAKTQG